MAVAVGVCVMVGEGVIVEQTREQSSGHSPVQSRISFSAQVGTWQVVGEFSYVSVNNHGEVQAVSKNNKMRTMFFFMPVYGVPFPIFRFLSQTRILEFHAPDGFQQGTSLLITLLAQV